MQQIGSAFFRSDTDKCPTCGDFADQADDHRECPACGTRFTEYVVLQEGEPGELQNN